MFSNKSHSFSLRLLFSFDSRIGRTGRAGKKGVAVSFFVTDKNGRMAKDIIEILNRTTQNVPNELHQAAMSSRGGGGRGRGRGGRRY